MLSGLGLIQPLGGLGPWWSLIARGPVVVFIDDERQAWGDKRKKKISSDLLDKFDEPKKEKRGTGERSRERAGETGGRKEKVR